MPYLSQRRRLNYDLRRWFTHAWNVFRMNWDLWGLLELAVAVPLVIAIIPTAWKGVLTSLSHTTGDPRSTAPDPQLSIIWIAVTAIASVPLEVGASAIMLKVIRGEGFQWTPLWTGFRKWPHCFVVGLIVGVLIFGPFSIMESAGYLPVRMLLYLWARYAYYTLSETGSGYGAAIVQGADLMRRNLPWAVLLALVSWLLIAVGVLACGIGILFSLALAHLLVGAAYDDLVRQKAIQVNSSQQDRVENL